MGEQSTAFGTAGGTLLTVVAMPSTTNILATIILACIGAITSFFISLLLKYLVEKIKQW